MARPKKKIDEELVRKLASIMCTMPEIAAVCECSEDTLHRRFAGTIKEARERGCVSLRRKQYEMAMTGNMTALIWLGKQYLEQTDKSKQEFSGANGTPLVPTQLVVVLPAKDEEKK